MKLESLQNRPLSREEQIFRKAYNAGNHALWSKPMTIDEYEEYEKSGLAAKTEQSHYYREMSMDKMGITVSTVASDSNVGITLHRRYSYPVLHNHEYVEIIYVAEGECRNFINETSFDMHAGDVCIMAPYSFHALSCTNDESCILNIMINRSFFDQNFLKILKGGKLLIDFLENILYEKSVSSYIMFPTGDDLWLRTLAQHMVSETVQMPHAFDYSVSLLASEFLLHLVRDWEMKAIVPSQQSHSQNNLIVAVLSYLSVNYNHATLSDTANYFGYSSAYLSRMIRDNTGKTFNSIISQLQMEHAAELLLTTDKSLTDIAHEVGCFDSSHFGRKFRKYYGVLPKQYAAVKKKNT